MLHLSWVFEWFGGGLPHPETEETACFAHGVFIQEMRKASDETQGGRKCFIGVNLGASSIK